MPKPLIGFIVDGLSEIEAIGKKANQTSANVKCMKRASNGKTVTTEKIANEAIPLLNALNSKGAILSIVIVDKEDRTISRTDFENDISNKISAKFNGTFKVISADHMFENWILADIEEVSNKHSATLRATNNNVAFDSCNGASRLKDLYKNQNISYSKTIDGPVFFKSIRPNIAINFCASFKDLYDYLNSKNINIF